MNLRSVAQHTVLAASLLSVSALLSCQDADAPIAAPSPTAATATPRDHATVSQSGITAPTIPVFTPTAALLPSATPPPPPLRQDTPSVPMPAPTTAVATVAPPPTPSCPADLASYALGWQTGRIVDGCHGAGGTVRLVYEDAAHSRPSVNDTFVVLGIELDGGGELVAVLAPARVRSRLSLSTTLGIRVGSHVFVSGVLRYGVDVEYGPGAALLPAWQILIWP